MTDVVVTGLGVVAPTGLGVDAYWDATVNGVCGISELTGFDVERYRARLAGQITDFVGAEHLPGRLLAQSDRVTQLALVAGEWAMCDAGVAIAPDEQAHSGVVTSNGTGGFEYSHREMRKLWTEGWESVSVYQCFAWFYAVNTGQLSIRHKLRGPGAVIVAEQAGGLDAVAHARRTIRSGRSRLMVTGGVESSFDPWGWLSHVASGRLSTQQDAKQAYLPFDERATGYVPGEGGAILVLEDARKANDRGRRPYGRVTGYAATLDPPPGSGRPGALRRAVDGALRDADLTADAVDLVIADAAGTPDLDAVEADVLAAVFGRGGVPVSAPKAGVGRLMAGGGPLDLVCALLAIRDQVIPPTPNVDAVLGGHHLDLVTGGARATAVDTVLVLARGAGGFNSAVIVQK